MIQKNKLVESIYNDSYKDLEKSYAIKYISNIEYANFEDSILHDFLITDSVGNESPEKMLKETFNECVDKNIDLLQNIMKNEVVIDGYTLDSEKKYNDVVKEYGSYVSSMLLKEIYLRNADDTKTIKSLLSILAGITPNELYGIDDTILAYALLNADYEIRDLALNCYERWNSQKYLKFLKSIEIGVKFLDEYRLSIIDELEYKDGK